MANTQTPFHPDQSSLITYLQHPQPNNNFVLQPSFNTNYMQQPMQNPKDISDPTTAIDMALVLMAKAFTLNDTTPTNNNQRRSSNPSNMQIAQPMQNVKNHVVLNAVQNSGVPYVGNQNGISVDPGIANYSEEFDFMAAAGAYDENKGRLIAIILISQQLVDEFVDEGVPADEPRFEDEEADIIQKGKGKEKVGEEQAAQVLLNLQTTKKNPAEQFIFQRRTPAPIIPSSHEESSSLYVELGLTDSETESDNEASREGQAGSDPGKLVEGQAGSDPGVAADSRIQPSHVVHAGPNLEHMNLEISDTSPQPNPKQMDEGFTIMAYPNVQENLKIPIEGEVRLEEPASSVGTLSSMQNLDKELSFTNQFLAEKSQEDKPEKINTEVEVQFMVTIPIHQDTSSVPLMTSPIIDLTVSQPASTTVQASLPIPPATTAITTTTTFPSPPPQPQQRVSNSIIIKLIGELERCIADLVDENQTLEERLDKQGNRIHQLETQDLSRMIREQTVEYIDKQEIDQKIKDTVKEDITASVQYAMKAPLRARFKDLPTSNIKEILL
ncbi:hypothetical protein Tco_0464366 [Tanacetum coccineum]